MKNKRLFIRILAVFLAFCFFPNVVALATDYNLLVPVGALTALKNGDLIYEGDTISDTTATVLTVNYFDYDGVTALENYSVSAASHTVLGAVDFPAADPGGDQKFVGWLVSNIVSDMLSSIDLTAYWEQAYRVTYNLNSGSGTTPVDSNLYLSGEPVPLNDGIGLSRPGHTFLGWSTEPDATVAMTSYSMDPDNNNLYAVWTAVSTYTVTYDGNGSDGGSVPVDDSSYTSGAAVTVLGNTGGLTRSGHTFTGWSNGTDTYTAGDTFTMGSADVTLYAVWKSESSGGGGGGTAITSYTLSYDGNGAISGTVPASKSYTKRSTVTVSGNTGALAKSGYKFSGWNTEPDGSGTGYAGGSTFTMGSRNIVLYAQWEKIKIVYDKGKWGAYNYYNVAYSTSDGKNTIVPTSYYDAPTDSVLYKTPLAGTYDAMYSFVGFDDINGSHWASGFIWFLSARMIVNGMGNGLYDPEGSITRAQFIKMLTCMTPGIDLSSVPSAGFLDVSPDDWYAKYIDWGNENNIVFGYGNGCFGPNDPITREQMCCMIARYCKYLGYELGEINSSKIFLDQDSISSWAVDDVDALQKSGLIEGDDNNMFNPQALSTRAQAAAIVCRLLMGILDAMVDPDSIPCS
jgi:uncharacterized repeat protein (TIGR02543 family)